MQNILLTLIIMLMLTACSSKTKEELYSEGLKQLNAENPSGAVVLFKSALEKDENYLDARFQLAKAYAKLGKKEQAEKEFLKVLSDVVEIWHRQPENALLQGIATRSDRLRWQRPLRNHTPVCSPLVDNREGLPLEPASVKLQCIPRARGRRRSLSRAGRSGPRLTGSS